MSSILEYENLNQRINYPFIDDRVENISFNIPDSWFVDILVFDKTNKVGDVFISKFIVSNSTNTVSFVFTEVDGLDLLTTTIAFTDLASHVENPSTSFLSFENTVIGVKLVFGDGIVDILVLGIDKIFVYLPQETKLVSTNVIGLVPMVQKINFLNYPDLLQIGIDSTIILKGGSNFNFTSSNGLAIDILPRGGTGLYDGCNDGFNSLKKINGVIPDANGNINFLNSDCYTLSLLDSEELIIRNLELSPYAKFSIPHQSPNIVNLLDVGHSFILENNCEPKCPSENLAAYAYYLNRTYDGVKDLIDYATIAGVTCGIGTINGFFLTAASFSTTQTGQSGFVKYFHEGINIVFKPTGGKSFVRRILEVVNVNSVRFEAITTDVLAGVSFCLDDQGLVPEFNQVVINYAPREPYARIVYYVSNLTKFNGVSGNLVSVVASVYNTSDGEIQIQALFDPNDENFILRIPDTLRITKNDVIYEDVNNIALLSGESAKVEEVFIRVCGNNISSHITATVSKRSSPVLPYVPVVTGTKTIDLISTPCPGIGVGGKVSAIAGHNFCFVVPTGGGKVFFDTGTLPPWATTHQDLTSSLCHIAGIPNETQSTNYYVRAIISNTSGSYSYTITIQVFLPPVISTSVLNVTHGVFFSKSLVVANNPTGYSALGLPTGASINSITGIISGIVASAATYSVIVTAGNAAGSAIKTISLIVG